MQTFIFYLVGLGIFSLVAGAAIAFVALCNAPEGFEDKDGFVGLTRGDEILLKQFGDGQSYSTVRRSLDLAA